MTIKAKRFALALALIFLLAACGNGETAQEPVSLPIEEEAESGGAAGLPEEETDQEEDDELQPEMEEEAEPAARGVIEGDVFTSEFAGLRFTLPGESWRFLTDQEIADAMGVGVEIMADEGFDHEDLDLSNLYDMVAQNTMTGSSLLVMIENQTHIPGAEQFPASVYVEQLRQQLTAIARHDYTFEEDRQIELGGHTFDVLTAHLVVDEVYTSQHYLVRRQGNHMIILIASLFGDIALEQILASFD
ncbi:MAG: hypothetical protein FWE32_08030 [Oscillospiraceae bacterium]|nr:hypothetical protein [Oscillospiraceae bacterium]